MKFPIAIMAGSLIGSLSVYGRLQPDLPPGNPMTRSLPDNEMDLSKITEETPKDF